MSNEKGIALVTSLLLVAITGLLGVTVMKSSSNEFEVSVAQEIEKTTFSVAESAAMQAYTILDVGTMALGEIASTPVDTTDERIDVEVTARQDGMVPAINSSLSAFGLTSYSIRSVASNESVNSLRAVTLGAVQRTPAPQ